jgi:hypothetical protein
MRSIRIPFLIDLKRVDDKSAIRALAVDEHLDRVFAARGPLINRILIARITGALCVAGKRLSAVAPRGDTDRAAIQEALYNRLDPAKGPLWDDATLRRLIQAVCGDSSQDVGPAAQQAVGRLFRKGYVADAESFQAACDLDSAVRTTNPVRLFALYVIGRLRRSRALLQERVGGDRAGVHGTGVAVHNLVRGFDRMRELWRASPRPPADEAVRACLFAPPAVLRQANIGGSTAAGDVRPGTLVVLGLGKAREASPDAEIVFMAGTWAECPAAAFVPALLRAVWDGAIAAEAGAKCCFARAPE